MIFFPKPNQTATVSHQHKHQPLDVEGPILFQRLLCVIYGNNHNHHVVAGKSTYSVV